MLKEDAQSIITAAIAAAQPDRAVEAALRGFRVPENGRTVLVCVGKAAWSMAAAALRELSAKIDAGIVITKHGYSRGALPNVSVYEGGHPLPDEESFAATKAAVELVKPLGKKDTVLFLVSGGGSALFELPLLPKEQLVDINKQLLACGADIEEINTVRKRLSAVKGGRFAQLCAPAQVFAVILSDVLSGEAGSIASGPVSPDHTSCEQALSIAEKYKLILTPEARSLLGQETVKSVHNVDAVISGSVKQLCAAAKEEAARLGYCPCVLTDCLCCTARDAGSFFASIARTNVNTDRSLAFIAGGETVVKLCGNGLGGRNQELALSAAQGISGLRDTAVFSVGSDGTDGPTDAAGGFCTGDTASELAQQGVDLAAELNNNNSYYALQRCNGLIITGPTGTNVNDLTVLLIKR